MKIVSLLPSATEIVCCAGFASNLVGLSHECDFPESIGHLPRLTRSRVNAKASSSEIHRTVEELIRNSISVYDLDVDLLKELNPDFIVTQDICDVCAIPFHQVEEACKTYLNAEAKIISLKPRRLGDIWQDVARVAETLGAPDNYAEFQRDVDRRIQSIRDKIESSRPKTKKVLTIEWINPVMVGGMWVPEMIEIAGGETLLAAPGENAPMADFQQLSEIDPEVVVIKPCGFKLDQLLSEMDALKRAVPWEQWTAYQTRQVYLVDGNSYFNRPGPRIMDSLEILAACIHPNLFPEFLKKYKEGLVLGNEVLKVA